MSSLPKIRSRHSLTGGLDTGGLDTIYNIQYRLFSFLINAKTCT